MITELKRFIVSKDRYVSTFVGNEDDTKPTGKINGSRFIDIDNGIEYLYDEENDTWHEQPKGGEGYEPNPNKGIKVESNKLVIKVDGESITFDSNGNLISTAGSKIKHTEDDIEVEGITLPTISNEVLTEIYNAIMTEGRLVYLESPDSNERYAIVNAKNDGTNTFIYLVCGKDCLVEYKSTSGTDADISIAKLGGGQIIDIGSNQFVYDSYSLPAIDKDDLVDIYNNHKAAKVQVIKWTLLGSETYLKCVSADYIAGNFSIDVLVHNKYHCQYTWNASTTGLVNPEVKADKQYDFLSLRRMGDYLFEVTFDDIPEYKPINDVNVGGCSAFVRDGKLYRTYDWFYDNTAEFLVRTKNFEGMSMIMGMEDGSLDFDKVGQSPYHIVDGINKDGVMISTHILFNDFGYQGSGDKDQSILQLPYFVMENVHSIASLETVMADYFANMEIPTALAGMEYLLQFIVTDGTTIKVITPPTTAGGTYSVVDATSNPKLTNFRWVEDATVDRTNLQTRPTGVARWNSIDDEVELSDLRFTIAYETPTRLDEFIGEDGTTKDSTDEELMVLYNEAHSAYPSRTRNGVFWQTVHAVVYGANGIEHLYAQENFEKDYISSTDETKVDNATIEFNDNKELQIKDEAITKEKVNPELKSTEIPSEDATDDKLATEKAVKTELDKKINYTDITYDDSTHLITFNYEGGE